MNNYPTWKVRGSPTPYEFLAICDKCGHVEWSVAGWPAVKPCPKHGPFEKSHARMREATAKEYTEAKAALKEVI